MSFSGLPDDLLLNVLERLPVDSLLRFRCVSKSWITLIDSEEFVKAHLNRSIMDTEAHKIIWEIIPYHNKKTNWVYIADFHSPDKFKETWAWLEPPSLLCNRRKVSLAGFCNGLFCIYTTHSNVFLWNPWMSKHWKLPVTRFQVEKVLSVEDKEIMNHKFYSYGFGYDDATDDYKVVRILEIHDHDDCSLHSEFRIYSFKSNAWRRLPLPDFPYYLSRFCSRPDIGLLVNSALHWLMGSEYYWDSNHSIAAIDLRTEEYRLIPQPDNISDYTWDLGVVKDCHSLQYIRSPGLIEMWIMKSYGIKDSWTKLLSVELPNEFLYPLSLTPIAYSECNGQLVFLKDCKEFLWYDTEKRSAQKARIDGAADLCMFPGYSCFGSLVQPYGVTRKGVKRRSSRLHNMDKDGSKEGRKY